MKNLLFIVVCLSIILLPSKLLFAQKIIAIDEELNANSTRIEVTVKGLIPKYKFGEFEMISRKTGWMTTTNKFQFYFDFTDEGKLNRNFLSS
ncbi:hypothetical protein [Mangrovibacterium lignilyticum]|uniref:hypothetical protein n=1 Tax=Mangrovibacterium lignilyticum TaxID=2668052 RepID=UPI0013D656EA|nr:hypothetical protein [Mangrovibacterium lignilyticum]